MHSRNRSRCLPPKAVHARLRSQVLPACSRFASRFAWCAAVCLLSGLSAYGRPRAVRTAPQLSPFEHAEHLHAELEEQPQQQRTRGDYERVLDAYRLIYHVNPASAKADASIVAVAGLLAEEGRLFHSGKSLHDAIAQYEFLRHQYPFSRYRSSALLAEGQIYRADLNDPKQAKATFQEFLKTYPRRPLASQARVELKEIREEESLGKDKGRHEVQDYGVAEIRPPAESVARSVAPTVSQTIGEIGPASHETHSERAAAMPSQRSQVSSAAQREQNTGETAPPTPVLMISAQGSGQGSSLSSGRDSGHGPVLGSDFGSPSLNRGRSSRVTAIRDWSTINSTRIAINLDAQVEYQAARVSHPDRIYFDLRDARLSPELAGVSMAVTDGGFLRRIRAAQYSDGITRIVLDVSAATDYSAFLLPNPWRLIIDIHGRNPSAYASKKSASLDSTAVPISPRILPRSQNKDTRNELDMIAAPPPALPPGATQPAAVSVAEAAALPSAATAEPEPGVALSGSYPAAPGVRKGRSPTPTPTRETQPAPGGDLSLARTLGLKIDRIVIDAGHGGHDCGTLGPGGIEEKNITLDVALRLGKLLKRRLGADVVYTRDDDTFIPLEMRTAIANRSHADLFISIHANSSSDPAARGVESYYLNFTTSPEALEVAARENQVSDESIYQLSDLVKKITLRDKIEESREFATEVQQSLYDGLEAGNPGLKDRGVKKAPFVVLIGANMPSILAEISFLTNPDDARELRQPTYRQRIAESLYRGVAKYINGLNGVRLAQNGQHPGN